MSWPLALCGNSTFASAGHHQRIDDPQQNRGHDGHQYGSNKILLHCGLPYASPTRVISMSISLIPMNGTMMPPTP